MTPFREIWAELFIRIRQIQGINETDEYVLVKKAGGTNYEGFVVKNWTFGAAGTASGVAPYTHLNINPLSMPFYGHNAAGNDCYNWDGTPEVSDDPGIPGQGSANPASFFNNHQFVYSAATSEYYDPSYGVKYDANLLDFAKALDGYYKYDRMLLKETDYGVDLDGDMAITSATVNTVVVLFYKNKTPSGSDLIVKPYDF